MQESSLPALDVPLDANADGHSEPFKHLCIVQAGRCGFHCHKSNVTARHEASATGTVTISCKKVFPQLISFLSTFALAKYPPSISVDVKNHQKYLCADLHNLQGPTHTLSACKEAFGQR